MFYVANLSHLVDAKQLLSLCKTGKLCEALPPAHGGDFLPHRPAGVAKIDPGTKERSRVNPASLAANGNCFETASIWIDLNFIRNI